MSVSSTWWGSKNCYSTDEQVVGEWIDGKPLYQKSYKFTNLTITDTTSYVADISALHIAFGMVTSFVCDVSGYFESDGFFVCWLRVPNNNIGIRRLNTGSDSGVILYVTIQYTKTTD